MNSDDRFQRVCEIFEQARRVPEVERHAFLREASGGDDELSKEVQDLLSHHEHETGLLDRPVTPASALAIADQIRQSAMPQRIGRYTILRKLGEGGMGVVYLAQQDQPAREVAIKVMRPGLMSKEMLRRFELETTVLGRLQHPSVAQIYEAGIDDEGGVHRPFFVMEYVEGRALDRYVRESVPSVRQRLNLFTQICDAVHHAHQKGVIHRDLKPSNIIVVSPATTASDLRSGTSRPTRPPAIKILDFGVARATDADLQVTSLRTDLGQLVGTLPYMSPEQIGGQAQDVDTRSDVYALGVVLYELLAGKLPYELNQQAIVSAAQIITEQDPAPLSTVSSVYRGDLNTIALKALEKVPDRRYASASDLAADVQRYLDNQPIVARRASAVYQARKFASRNKGLVAGLAAALAMLVIGVIASSVFAIGQTRALRESEQQRAVSRAVIDFLNDDLLAQANPEVSGQRDVTVRALLDSASEKIAERFPDQPQVEMAIRNTMGRSYIALGAYDVAEAHLERAISLSDQSQVEVDDQKLEMHGRLIQTKLIQWKLDDAEALALESVALAKEHLGARHPRTARLLSRYAVLLKRRGKFAEAEDHYRQALDIMGDHGESLERMRIITTNNMLLVIRDQGRYSEAEALARGVIDDWTEFCGRKHLDTAFGLINLGDILWYQATQSDADANLVGQKLDEAERLFREALAIRQELLGEEHPDTANAMYAIGLVYSARKNYAEGERWQRKALAIRQRAFASDENVFVLNSMDAVATTLRRQNRHEEAADLSRQALTVAEKAFGVQHYSSERYRGALYAAYWNLGNVPVIEELNEKYENILTEDKRAWGIHALAEAHATNGEFEKAIEIKRRAIEMLPQDSSLRKHWKRRLEELSELNARAE